GGGGGAGVYRLDTTRDGAHLVYFGIGNSDLLVLSFAGDGAHGLWIGTNVGLCRRAVDGHIEWFSNDRGPPADSVNALLLDKDTRLWVGTYNGLWLLNQDVQASGRAMFQRYGRREGLASERIHSFFQSSTGDVWIGTAAGLAEFPAAAGTLRFRNYGSAEGLRGRVVFAINQSKDGSLWVGVDHGLARISKSGFLRYTEADGMGELGVTAFAQDLSGQLYAVSNELRGPELHRLDGRKFDTIRPAYPANLKGSGWGLEQIVLIAHSGEWWFATGEGLIRFPAVKSDELPHTPARAVYTAKKGLPSSAILRIFEDSHSRVLGIDTPRASVVVARHRHLSSLRARRNSGVRFGVRRRPRG
ncbi:MAG: two-component regulator propeller domain-containing protein, partial [Bryobacteraceae bacterium]